MISDWNNVGENLLQNEILCIISYEPKVQWQSTCYSWGWKENQQLEYSGSNIHNGLWSEKY